MSENFRQFFKNYNNFSKGDRNTIIIIGILIVAIFVAIPIVNGINPKPKFTQEEFNKFQKLLELQETTSHTNYKSLFYFDPNTITKELMDSLNLPEFVKKNIISYQNAGGRFSEKEDFRKIYGMNDSIYDAVKDYLVFENFEMNRKTNGIGGKQIEGYFDPNQAEIEELTKFGFNSFQAENLIAFRNKGGVFNEKEDLLKIYGIDSSFYETVHKHVIIELKKQKITDISTKKEFEILELNSADSTSLVALRGIGPVFAKRIIKYRDLLGGFYSTSQLLEVYSFPEETYRIIESKIIVDTVLIKKIRINFTEYDELIRHPYIGKKDVEAILKYRNQKGSIKNIHQLKDNGLIDNETFLRIGPYLTCR